VLFWLINWVFWVTVFAAQLWALIDCARHPAGAFLAAGKATKRAWLAATGGAVIVGLLNQPIRPLMGPLGNFAQLLTLAALVVAVIYLVSVRPALGSLGRGPRPPQTGTW
jgi:hypothetical protein